MKEQPGKDFSRKMLGSNSISYTTNGHSTKNGTNGTKKVTIAVEGNIGSGKTTLLKFFKQNPLIEVLEEPVQKWQNVDGGNILELMYKDPKRWSFMFESYVLLTMMQLHHQKQETPVRLLERSAYSAFFCFIENLYLSGMLSQVEYSVFQEWFEYLAEHQKPHVDLIIYLRTSPEICFERMQKRRRSEESSVSMDLLTSLHERYEEWLLKKTKFYLPAPVVVVDGNQSLEKLSQYYENNTHSLFGVNEISKIPVS
ncbi:thymidine kinase 2, mitochondrial-like isoform X2 [Actinia tenebrosa]|uniref:Thymidine kinase 2, mitochondrial-like isoform X2 n=1 Tax=Actinia tenebrosa TaxID=6105 RepID=A0A6P8IC02_ACTTE|nr:thymidine kinase 2, mitochondrial-like isoform X2 [Actinia tenebrosa]